jgi:hypothetical protein
MSIYYIFNLTDTKPLFVEAMVDSCDRHSQPDIQIIQKGQIMKVLEAAEVVVVPGLEHVEFSWWVEIVTDAPRCIYYFGPFSHAQTAKTHIGGYMEDLLQEGAEICSIEIKQCQPGELTIEG